MAGMIASLLPTADDWNISSSMARFPARQKAAVVNIPINIRLRGRLDRRNFRG
jgi:hypothetical protein